MNSKEEILNKLESLLPYLKGEYSVKSIGLFGSFADDTFDKDSDIDLLVELDKPIGWKFFTLQLFLEKELSRKVDLVTQKALKESMKESILNKVLFV